MDSRARPQTGFQTASSFILGPSTAAPSAQCPLESKSLLVGGWAVLHQNNTVGPSLETWFSRQRLTLCTNIPLHCGSKNLIETPAQPFSRLPCYTDFSQLPGILQEQDPIRGSSIWLSTLDPPSPQDFPQHTLSQDTPGLSLFVPPVGILSGSFQNMTLTK